MNLNRGFLLIASVNCKPYKIQDDVSIGGLELVLKAAGKIFTPSRREWRPKTLEEALLPLMMDDKPKDELTPPSEEPFNFYLPPFYHEEDYNKELKDTLIPPSTSIDKTNYYATPKPKKTPKKYIPGAKQINLRVTADDGELLYSEPLDELDYYDDQPKKSMIPLKSFLPPMPIKLTDYEDNVSVSSVPDLTYVKPNAEVEQIKEIKFQFRGMGGPDSYKFGYDTGKGKNRQYRFEEKDHLGNVVGEYGYYDKKKGEMLVTKFIASKNGGFHVL